MSQKEKERLARQLQKQVKKLRESNPKIHQEYIEFLEYRIARLRAGDEEE